MTSLFEIGADVALAIGPAARSIGARVRSRIYRATSSERRNPNYLTSRSF
jgi:hypothetical protein